MATGVQHSTQTEPKKEQVVGKVEKDVKPFQQFLTKFGNDWAMTFAGGLAYSLLMAMLPIAIALVAVLGIVLGNANRNDIIAQITKIFPGAAGQQNAINLAIEQLSKQAGPLAIIAILLAIFGGSRLFIAIENYLDIIYRVRPRTLIPQNVMAFLMFIVFIFLVPIMVFTSSAPSFIMNFLGTNPVLRDLPFVQSITSNPFVVYVAGIIGGLIAAFMLFEAIYVVVPNQKISWRNSWRGALVSAVALELFLILFPIYVQFFLKSYAGQIGFAVVLLLFFYYFAVILMLGAEVNAFFFEKVQPIPNDLATFVSTMAGTLNRDIPDAESDPHQNPAPTLQKDRRHIAEARLQEEENKQRNSEKQQKLTANGQAKKKQKENKENKHGQAQQDSSKKWTILSVALGSVLTMVIELLQLRHHGK